MAEKKKKGATANILVDAAKAGAPPVAAAAPAKARKKGKLIKTKTHRLPRKQKKAQQKLAAAKA